jgi:hypothetical protein
MAMRHDLKIVNAILSAPAFLSGMTEEDASKLRSEVLQSQDPSVEKIALARGVETCRSAVKAAANLIRERANLRLDDDGEHRLASEPAQMRKA